MFCEINSDHPDVPILITGGGTMGLLTLFNLRALGCETVDLVEPRLSRHGLAMALGARRVVTPDQFLGDRREHYRVGIECSGVNEAFALLQHQLQPGGRLCVLADARRDPLVLTPAFHEKELQLTGSSDGDDYHGYARWYWPHARRQCNTLERFFEQRVLFAELPACFATLAETSAPPLKVLIDYTTASHF